MIHRVLAFLAVLLLGSAAPLLAQSYDSGDPTPQEQLILEIINRARAAPVAEGGRLSDTNVATNPALTNGLSPGIPGGDITEGLTSPNNLVGARPPLAMNKILLGTARAHNTDMYNNDIFQHNSSTGVDPQTRMTNAMYFWNVSGGLSGENIVEASGPGGQVNGGPDQLENVLMIDNGITDRGHRVNLLDTRAAPWYREIGIGYLSTGAPTATLHMTDLATEDFGRIPTNGPFVLGVVYDDSIGVGFYAITAGLAGVTISLVPAGPMSAVTGTAGGYAFPADTTGSITVQATGGPFGTAVVTKTILPPFPGENVKVDFLLSEATGVPPPPPPPPPPPGGSTSTPSVGVIGCGSTGLDLLWPLLFLWLRRRVVRR